MKLFFKDHMSIIILYGISFLLLPWMIQALDDLTAHYFYFIFLVSFLFILWLVGRYYRRRRLYTHLEKEDLSRDDLHLYEPQASIEQAYSEKLRQMQYLHLTQQQQLEEQAEEKHLVLSHFAHQMKTPLSVIQLLTQSASTMTSNELQQWQTISKECDKLTFTLNQLLTYERSSNLVADLKIEPILLKELVKEVVNDLKDYFITKEVFPKLTLAEDQMIYSDRKWLKVVLYQVLNNAVKYSEVASTVHIDYDNDFLHIDNRGETIPTNEISRVFDLFYTGKKGRTNGEATGIGLFLVKKVLTILDHPFTLQSSHDHTKFSINFSSSLIK
ncbi:HAMP domain-containing sensor histidine kinase [Lysinibacillus sp. FSL M8-0216]|uniref:sensor histidine kinase n=1 Tax=Lysinibacillus TaxID=400634 RepID=UPI00088A1CD8|nr:MULTISPECIES: HAMP domain-containing sensor histidine kinase [Lysinibacillus]HAU35428.1 sensor histidine kinase [Lysinibacillus sp.]MCG7433570.1 HAMP domain-containing histidine kinase [Lysinibacillus fusiformis]MED4667937.1 HAMP domain-containing sensor histidine kinase [Lysinibacillus fusiformis]NOG27907.1 HAMP domain-containing histidine kinase [Lysinibacillus fusiformis]QAS58357.1 sensor histidine kinase [Lysinibacillus sphaericus]